MKMYPEADEKLVRTFIAYGDADEGNLFSDEKKTVKMTKDEVFNWFLKGLIIVFSNEYYKPITYAEVSGAAKVTVAKDSGTAATLYNFYSSEHEAD